MDHSFDIGSSHLFILNLLDRSGARGISMGTFWAKIPERRRSGSVGYKQALEELKLLNLVEIHDRLKYRIPRDKDTKALITHLLSD